MFFFHIHGSRFDVADNGVNELPRKSLNKQCELIVRKLRFHPFGSVVNLARQRVELERLRTPIDGIAERPPLVEHLEAPGLYF